jgi:hypothetical protein
MQNALIKGSFVAALSIALLIMLANLLNMRGVIDTFHLQTVGAIAWLIVLLFVGFTLRRLNRKRPAAANGQRETSALLPQTDRSALRMLVLGSALIFSAVVLMIGYVAAVEDMGFRLPPALPAIVLTAVGGAGFVLVMLGLFAKRGN